MSVRRPTAPSRALAGVALSALVAGGLTGCELVSAGEERAGGTAAHGRTEVVVTTNTTRRDVPVDTTLKVSARGGTLSRVTVAARGGEPLPGRLVGGGARWVAGERLEPGTTYVVRTLARTPDGTTSRATRRFSTQDLTLDQQTYATVAPLDGETVGVGMPVVVAFDVAVTDRAAMERHMRVTSTPRQRGSWHWLSDHEAHWRPAEYWRAGSRVSVDLDINGVHAGGGIYGQESRHVEFTVGDAHVYEVDAQAHTMQVWSNGSLVRTIPITTGKEGFTTRSGIKVVMEKHRRKAMRSETIGISDADDPDYYDLDDVEYAMRLTYSGEFIHAAPWSVGSQGSANVSHGCTGMSTADAAWLYAMTRRGDVVEYVGTDRPMEFGNGYGDWNVPFSDYRAGSALS